MIEIKQFYKTENVVIEGREFKLKSYQAQDGEEVTGMMKCQIELEDLARRELDEKGNVMELSLEEKLRIPEIKLQAEQFGVPLAYRGLKRALHPESERLPNSELDELYNDELELDVASAMKIAWCMIGLANVDDDRDKVEDGKKPKARKKVKKS